MSDQLVVEASSDRKLGSSSTRRLLREGLVPGVLYGLDIDPVSLSVPYASLRTALTTDAGLNALIRLKVGDEEQLSIVKELQRHPVRNDVIHVDFIRIDPNVEIQVDVPVILEGEAKEVMDNEGIVDQAMFSISVLSSPLSIPNEIYVDVSALTIGDAIRIADVVLPAGVRTEMDPEDAVAIGSITRAAIEEEVVVEGEEGEGLEGEEGAEGEGGEDAGDEGGDASDGDE